MQSLKMVWVAAAALLAACGGGGSSNAEEAPGVRISTIELAQHSALQQPQTLTVRDADGWARFWQQHKAYMLPAPAQPTVDFSRDELLAVALGPRPNGCWGVAITEVRDSAGERLVRYRVAEPAPGAICTQAVVHPVHVVAAPASRLPVRFEAVR